MKIDVGKEIATLHRMTTKELREKFAEVFGEPTSTGNRTWLVRRIAWAYPGTRRSPTSPTWEERHGLPNSPVTPTRG